MLVLQAGAGVLPEDSPGQSRSPKNAPSALALWKSIPSVLRGQLPRGGAVFVGPDRRKLALLSASKRAERLLSQTGANNDSADPGSRFTTRLPAPAD